MSNASGNSTRSSSNRSQTSFSKGDIMTNFLEFLNTADLASLTQIPGITRKTAGNIIAARPFDFVEECAKVPGMNKNLLGRAQSYFETEINESRNSALATVGEDSLPMVIDE